MNFFTVFLSVYTLLNGYLAWRIAKLPWLEAHVPPRLSAVAILVLAACFPLSWITRRWPIVAHTLKLMGTTWLGIFLLLLTSLLFAELFTLGGWLFQEKAASVRQYAVLIGLGLSAVSLVQARRPPAIVEYTLPLAGLPAERDGFRLVVASDLHLGTQLGQDWLKGVIERIHEQRPDAVALVGDLIDNDADVVDPMTPTLGLLKAPHGVYSVIGNHEYYAGDTHSASIMERAGFKVLRNEAVEVLPGLRMAGIDDLTVLARGGRAAEPLLESALGPGKAGATVLLSHTPLAYEEAAHRGVSLMLSGHTHDGQIWPFRYLVKTRYSHTYGLKKVGQITALVTRGVGTWGPRMRLWARGEIVVVTLRTPGKT
ncbi:MAG: metallophosphoesterase [Opitutaceae bacterium]|nr:metallophosphoesterase [Opitutaceae bacterium]